MSLSCVFPQWSRLISSEYMRNKIRIVHAKLCVSCFNRFGLAFPRNPEKINTREAVRVIFRQIYISMCAFRAKITFSIRALLNNYISLSVSTVIINYLAV